MSINQAHCTRAVDPPGFSGPDSCPSRPLASATSVVAPPAAASFRGTSAMAAVIYVFRYAIALSSWADEAISARPPFAPC